MVADGSSAACWRAKITLEYLGTHFAGSQYQPGQRTVQGVVEEALARLTGEWSRITLAGRTDTGVHASGQVASVDVPRRFAAPGLRRSLNALLPHDVAALAVEPMAASFHARFSALRRRYAYQIWNAPVPSPLRRATSWLVTAPLDVAAMVEAAQVLLGEHDFASFAGSGQGVPGGQAATALTHRTLLEITVTVVEAQVQGRLIRIEIEAPAFLPQMVRNIAGALVAVGRGAWSAARLAEVLAAADRRQSVATAPPSGVMLLNVTYGPEWQAVSPGWSETTRLDRQADDGTR